MKINLSSQAAALGPSPNLELNNRAKLLAAQGRPVINLTIGEPSGHPHPSILEAGHKAMLAGHTKYSASKGAPLLRESIANFLKRTRNVAYDAETEVIATPGAKNAIKMALWALINPGDRAILPTPYWGTYKNQVELFGGEAIEIETFEVEHFKLKPEILEQHLLAKGAKVLLLNSPGNPSGMTYSKNELTELAEVCLKYGVCILSDEIYGRILYDNTIHHSAAALDPRFRDITIVVDGLSKSHAMTGLRSGFAAGPAHIIAAMTNYASNDTTGLSTHTQCASIEAYKPKYDFIVQDRITIYDISRRLLVDGLNAIDGLSALMPSGAFYAFPNVSELFGSITPSGITLRNSKDVSEWLLTEYFVATVPGSIFAEDSHIRLSYAGPKVQIEEALERIEKAVNSLS